MASVMLGGCIEDPPSLSRDPGEREDLDQAIQVSGAERAVHAALVRPEVVLTYKASERLFKTF